MISTSSQIMTPKFQFCSMLPYRLVNEFHWVQLEINSGAIANWSSCLIAFAVGLDGHHGPHLANGHHGPHLADGLHGHDGPNLADGLHG